MKEYMKRINKKNNKVNKKIITTSRVCLIELSILKRKIKRGQKNRKKWKNYVYKICNKNRI
jgi:hypothetical protein